MAARSVCFGSNSSKRLTSFFFCSKKNTVMEMDLFEQQMFDRQGCDYWPVPLTTRPRFSTQVDLVIVGNDDSINLSTVTNIPAADNMHVDKYVCNSP